MKLNRKWLMVIALVLSMSMAISGTLAYLTDRDTVENTFTMGNVDIEVEEKFEQDSPLYPGVDVEKEAGIKNTHATEPAYVWMVVSVPDDLADYIELNWADGYAYEEVESPHDGYTGYLVKYPNVLNAGESTGNILESVKLTENVDYQNGQYVAVSGGEVTAELGNLSNVSIMVDGFAIQTEGFADVNAAYTAYTNQWGGLTGGESSTNDTSDIPEDATHVQTFEELKAAIAAEKAGGTVVLDNDIVFPEPIVLENGEDVVLHMNGYTITPESTKADPFFDTYPGTTLVLTGDGTFDLGNNPSMSVLMPGGNVTIKNGTFLKGQVANINGPLIAAYSRAEGQFIIEGGYFDSGYYKEGDCFNNCRNGVNLTSGNTYRIYGGTFVGQNPAWGDEGRAVLCPHCNNDGSNCQGIFLEGQTSTSTELPEGYTITEGTTEDGRPTYTVTYSK